MMKRLKTADRVETFLDRYLKDSLEMRFHSSEVLSQESVCAKNINYKTFQQVLDQKQDQKDIFRLLLL